MNSDWQARRRNSAVPPNGTGLTFQRPSSQQYENQRAVSQDTRVIEEVAGKQLNFSQLSLYFAIDVSTSTARLVLEQERSAVTQIHKLLSPSEQTNARAIPWSGQSFPAIPVKEIQSLEPSYGTDPTTIYDSKSHIEILQRSSLWFLITDGQMPRSLIEKFAQQTLDYGLHGTSSVIIIFGTTMKRGKTTRPAEADISVGMSIFALAANCLYLYNDIWTKSGLVYILQAKGCFRQFLPDGKALTLSPSTSWNDLPRISYSDLAKVNIPAPTKLGRDEIALENNMRISLDDMYAGNIDKTITDQIIGDSYRMTSIVLSEVARGRSEKLQNYLTRQSAEDARNPGRYSKEQASSRSQTIYSASARINSVNQMQAPTSASLSALDEEPLNPITHYGPQSRRLPSRYSYMPDNGLKASLNCKGSCMKCGRQGTIALLFKQPPLAHSTPNFPQEFSRTPLSFPLAMGESCAEAARGTKTGTNSELITSILVLKPYNSQPEKWIDEISSAFSYRFSEEDVAQVFLAVCDSTLQRLSASAYTPSIANSKDSIDSKQLISALSWIRSELLYHADLAMLSFSDVSSSFSKSLAQSGDFYMMECPLEAFAVYIRLEKDFHFIKWSDADISDAIFRRLLLHLSQAYAKMLSAYGALETGMIVMPLLFHNSDDQRMTLSFRDLKFKASVDVSDLSTSEILDEESMELFLSLGEHFTPVRMLMAPATAVFLHHLIKFGTQNGDSSYQPLRVMFSLDEVFSNPRGIGLSRSTQLIRELLKRSS